MVTWSSINSTVDVTVVFRQNTTARTCCKTRQPHRCRLFSIVRKHTRNNGSATGVLHTATSSQLEIWNAARLKTRRPDIKAAAGCRSAIDWKLISAPESKFHPYCYFKIDAPALRTLRDRADSKAIQLKAWSERSSSALLSFGHIYDGMASLSFTCSSEEAFVCRSLLIHGS